MSKKEITMKEFADELVSRLNSGKTVDCCKEELVNLAGIVKEKLPDEKIQVNWVD
jgi:chromosomal replication initiation ATPase DnaA